MDREMSQRFGIGLLVAWVAACLQGCLAAAWIAAVGVGTSMSGSVEFDPFENTWVPPADAWVALEPMDSVAVPPFAGDEAMATRFAAAFRDLSTFRVVDGEQLADRSAASHPQAGSPRTSAHDQARLARAIASRAHVDCVLFGRVVTGWVQTDKWGNKEVTSHRLKLTLVDAKGRTLWKDELPYRVIEGAQPFPEEWFQESLTTHLAAHARAIGLARIGLPDKKTQARRHSRLDRSGGF